MNYKFFLTLLTVVILKAPPADIPQDIVWAKNPPCDESCGDDSPDESQAPGTRSLLTFKV